MSDKKHITASCTISNHVIYKNKKAVFENKGADLYGFLESAYQYFNMNHPRFHKMDRLSQLGLLATEALLRGTFDRQKYQSDEIAIVLSNSNASLDTDIRYHDTLKKIASPALFVYTLPNIMIGEICIRNDFKGENAFFVFKQFDVTFMEQYVSSLLDNRTAKACICGWVELLREEYKAFMVLVEKGLFPGSILFTKKNMNKIDSLDNG